MRSATGPLRPAQCRRRPIESAKSSVSPEAVYRPRFRRLVSRLAGLNLAIVAVEAMTLYMYSIPPRPAMVIPGTLFVLAIVDLLAWMYYRQRTPRSIRLDGVRVRVEAHDGKVQEIAWSDVARHRHLDAIVCYHWVLTAKDGRQINIAELGMTRSEWRHLFDHVDKHVARYVM